VTGFQAGEQFVIPDSNSTISFARDGNYTGANLENGGWHFTHLRLRNFTLEDFTISAKNTNVVVLNFTRGFGFSSRIPNFRLTFNVSGSGTYSVNFSPSMNVTESNGYVDWLVFTGTGTGVIFMSLGKEWNFAPDGTIVINGITGNVTISYYGLSQYTRNLTAGLSFYEQHSVVIVVASIVCGAVVVTVVMAKLRQRREHTGDRE
jgi:hypothetical protein